MWVHFNPQVAQQELVTLVQKQFPSGLIPHMNYWRPATGFKLAWGTGSTRGPGRKRTVAASAQPPLLAQAVAAVHDQSRDGEFLVQMIPPMERYYDWLYAERSEQVSGDGLVAIIHPWESGMDLLPIWDHIHHIRRLFGLRTGRWLSAIVKAYNKVGWDLARIKTFRGSPLSRGQRLVQLHLHPEPTSARRLVCSDRGRGAGGPLPPARRSRSAVTGAKMLGRANRVFLQHRCPHGGPIPRGHHLGPVPIDLGRGPRKSSVSCASTSLTLTSSGCHTPYHASPSPLPSSTRRGP